MASNNIFCNCLRRQRGGFSLQRHCHSLPSSGPYGLLRLSEEASFRRRRLARACKSRATTDKERNKEQERGVFAERQLARAI